MVTESATYTVGELAERLSETGDPDDVARLARQVRHWTNMGLLKPVGKKHAGTGKHRRYNSVQMLKAAIISVIVKNLQLNVGALGFLMQAFDLKEISAMTLSVAPETPLYLTLPLKGGNVQEFSYGTHYELFSPNKGEGYDAALVINISAVVKRVFR